MARLFRKENPTTYRYQKASIKNNLWQIKQFKFTKLISPLGSWKLKSKAEWFEKSSNCCKSWHISLLVVFFLWQIKQFKFTKLISPLGSWKLKSKAEWFEKSSNCCKSWHISLLVVFFLPRKSWLRIFFLDRSGSSFLVYNILHS